MRIVYRYDRLIVFKEGIHYEWPVREEEDDVGAIVDDCYYFCSTPTEGKMSSLESWGNQFLGETRQTLCTVTRITEKNAQDKNKQWQPLVGCDLT